MTSSAVLNPGSLACPKCRGQLLATTVRPTVENRCPHCGTVLEIALFPAFFRAPEAPQAAEQVLTEGEAACFYHPQKRAVIPCESCGRFLCALCDVDLDGKHYCPNCLESGRKKGRIQKLEQQRTRYDQIALALVFYPLILCGYPSLITAPIAVFVALRYWNAPSSRVARTKLALGIALAFAVVEIAIWVLIFISFFT
ncbi:MAG: hypothetical protein AB1705_06940 [Verrucomicrobiota bacterium]